MCAPPITMEMGGIESLYLNMKVSIITICYNRENTIREAMESVLNQDYPDIEYIVVDGASSDRTLDEIRFEEMVYNSQEYRSNHPFLSMRIVSEPDGGMYEAINKGIRMATGDIIGLVHSDDMLYDRQVVSGIVKEFKKTNADFVYGDGIFVDSENKHRIVRNWVSGSYKKWKVRLGWLPLHPTCYIRREVMEREGLYDESYRIAADTDLLVRYLYKARLNVEYMHRRIIRMRMGGLSTDSEKRRLMWKEDIRLYAAHGFWALPTKLMKMAWKVPQFIEAKFM